MKKQLHALNRFANLHDLVCRSNGADLLHKIKTKSSTKTLIEVTAYYIPIRQCWLDHLKSSLAPARLDDEVNEEGN